MQNYFDFTGKVALVTGASSGIGRATAELLGKCGAAVAVGYHKNEKGANCAKGKIEDAGGKAIIVQSDVTKIANVEKMVGQVADELGAIDILVNNAGSLVERLRTLELTEDRWNEVFHLNNTSAFFCAKAVI